MVMENDTSRAATMIASCWRRYLTRSLFNTIRVGHLYLSNSGNGTFAIIREGTNPEDYGTECTGYSFEFNTSFSGRFYVGSSSTDTCEIQICISDDLDNYTPDRITELRVCDVLNLMVLNSKIRFLTVTSEILDTYLNSR